MSTVTRVSRLRRVFSGLTVTGVLLAGVVVAVADPTAGPVQAAPNVSEVSLTQLGADIDGEADGDNSGLSVALSADGNTAIIGAPSNDGANGTDSGHARIYEWDGASWVQVGADIDGEAAGDLFGDPVALSADGGTAIIGAPLNDGANGSNSGHARIYEWDGASWVQVGADIDGEATDDFFGGSVALSADGGTAIIGARGNGANGSDSGHARIYEWDGASWVQVGADIDGEAAGDRSGYSVALSADGDTAIIGAPYNGANGSDSGHARIYEWDGASWVQVGADIDGEAADDFSGLSVALSADGDTAIIGAPYNDGANGSNSGHARIYEWDGASWVQVGADIDGEAAGDDSGYSVALSADGDTAIIGAYRNDGGGTSSGHARIYEWDGTSWVQVGDDIDGETAFDQSGRSVALSADGDTAIIGARLNDANGSGSGHARIVVSTAWGQVGTDIDGEAAGDSSGWSVALSADGGTAIIGAIYNDGNGTSSGHARIYEWDGASWVQVGADIDGEAADDNFGGSVALSADGNTAIIGAPGNDDGGSDSGHARIYEWDGASWVQVGADIDGEAADDFFGESVALSADGDTAIIGAPNDAFGSDSGHARIYEWDGASWVQVGADIDGEAAGDNFGGSVALSADGGTAIIGARGNDANGTSSGHARIYEWNGASWVQAGDDIDGEAAGDSSGWSVALSADGGTAIIGAIYNDGGGTSSGHAKIYERNGAPTGSPAASWVQVGADIDGEAADDYSGWSVALSADGDTAIIGAANNDDNGNRSGHARIYERNGASWVKVGNDIDGEAADDRSGFSVALSADGDTAIIGARFNDGGGSNSGHARIYRLLRVSTPAMPNPATVVSSQPGTAVVSWTPGLEYEYGPVTGWQVEQSVNAGVTWGSATLVSTPGPAATTATVTALANGTEYRFRVAGINNVGTGPIAVSNTATPVAVAPGPPTAVLATAGDGQAAVAWSAPASNGGASITGYTVTSSPGSKTCATSGAFTCAVTALSNGTSYTFTVTATNTVGTGSPSAASLAVVPVAPTGQSVSPGRVLESRSGDPAFKTVDGEFQGTGRTGAGQVREVKVTGRAGVPVDAEAVFLNVVAVNPSAGGYLTVFPCGITPPLAANVNYSGGDVAANAVLAKIGVGGKVCVFTLAATDLVIDVNGFTPAGAGTESVPPGRVLESRLGDPAFKTVDGEFQGTGRTGAGQVREVKVTGRAGVPVDAEAVFLNVVAVNPSAGGYLTVFPCGITPPLAANVNYSGGDVAANAVLAKIGVGGKVCVFTLAATDLVIDVNGFTPAGAGTESVPPGRVLESRSGDPAFKTVDGEFQGTGRTGAGQVREVKVTGRAGVPVDAEAVFLNVVAVNPSAGGYLTVFPCGITPPLAANVNYSGGDVAANAVLAKIGVGGKVCVFTLAATDLVIDVNGFTPAGAT